jgi:hypothetical protein
MSQLAELSTGVVATMRSCKDAADSASELQRDIHRTAAALEDVVRRLGGGARFREALELIDLAGHSLGSAGESASAAIGPAEHWLSMHSAKDALRQVVAGAAQKAPKTEGLVNRANLPEPTDAGEPADARELQETSTAAKAAASAKEPSGAAGPAECGDTEANLDSARAADDANRWGDLSGADLYKAGGEWANQLSPQEADAVRQYSGDAMYRDLNSAMRRGTVTPEQQTMIDNLDSAISKGEIPKDCTLYRGIANNDVAESAHDLIGQQINLPAGSFTSTSTSPRVAEDFAAINAAAFEQRPVIFELRVPEGTPAAFPETVGSSYTEREVLLGHDFTAQVTSVEERGGVTYFIAELKGGR